MMNKPLIAWLVGAAGVATLLGAGRLDPTGAPSTRGVGVSASQDSWDTLARRFGGVQADTKASRDVTMAFTISTEVRDVSVKGGQRVRENDLLVRARDTDQVALVDAQRMQAANENEIQAAALQLELAELKYSRLRDSGQGAKAELDEARIGSLVAKVQLEQARVRNDLDKKRLEQAEGQLERYRLKAPFDGVIEEVKVDVGQGVRESEPVLRIVSTDRLWLEAYTPTPLTIERALDKGGRAWVLVNLADKPRLAEGTILYVSPVGDSVSQRRRVRVEVVNTEGWPAGTPAKVVFADPGREWDVYRPATGEKTVGATTTRHGPAPITAQARGTGGEAR